MNKCFGIFVKLDIDSFASELIIYTCNNMAKSLTIVELKQYNFLWN